MRVSRPIRLATLTLSAALLGSTATLGGCANDAQAGAGLGALGGAAVGAVVGHQSGHAGEGALIGAGAGALGGYIIGNESDKKKAQHDHYHNHPNHDY